MTVALADAYRSIVITTQTTSGGIPGIATSTRPAGSFNLDAGFGISLVADAVNNKVTIVNTGNGTGALTTITDNNSAGTFYPIFTRAGAPGDINPNTSTYQMDTMYLDQTTTPMTYAPSTSTLTLSNIGVTSTATLGNALVGLSGNANFTRFPAAQMVISNVSTNQQNETATNIGLMAEALASGSNFGVGVFGAGYTSDTLRGIGVHGKGRIAVDGNAPSIGVMGEATNTHPSGFNIGLWGSAGNGFRDYALWMASGNIYSAVSQTWQLLDNNANALSLDANGKTGILNVMTTNAAEGVTMSGTLAVTGRVTLEGVTSTGATGTGNLVFGTSPSLTTPTLGVASATSINKMAITAPATSSTLAVADGKTFTVNNTITLGGTDSTTITLPATTGTVALNNQTFFIGSTSVAINRATASQSLTGITSIDGYAAGLAGGNATTLLGALPYQSAANTTTLLSPNTTATRKFLRMTGDGTNGAAPAWDTITSTDLGLNNVTNESKATMFTSPTFTGTTTLQQTTEIIDTKTGATGTVTHDFSTGSIWFHSTIAANFTANFTNVPTTNNRAITVALILDQGATAYIPNAIQIDGVAQTIQWSGGSVPSGTNNYTDIVNFTLIRSASAWTVLGSLGTYN